MSFSPFTREGILVGEVAFDLFSIFSRWLLVAFFCDLALRFCFKRRIGIFLVLQISVLAGYNAWRANHRLHSPSKHAKLATFLFFLFALVMTRGIDLSISSVSSVLRRNYSYQVAFVAAAVTDATSHYKNTSITSTPNMPASIERARVYQALHDITNGSTLSAASSRWPESIGSLSDAEVAAITLAGGRVCAGAPVAKVVETPPPPAPAVRIDVIDTTRRGLAMPHSLMMPLFGESVQFAELFINHPSQNAEKLAFGYTIPISTSYYIPQDGRSVAFEHSRQQFGVISMPNKTLGSYSMECGLDADGMLDWLESRFAKLGKGGAQLQFDDIHDSVQRGVTAATFTFSKNESNEVEVLSFGASFSKPSLISSDLQTVSSATVSSRSVNGSAAPVTTSFTITSESDVTTNCTNHLFELPVAFPDSLDALAEAFRKGDREPADRAIMAPKIQECDIKFSHSASSSMKVFLSDRSTAAQICHTRVRRYDIPNEVDDFNHYVSARYSTVADRSTMRSVECMHRDQNSHFPITPTLPLAALSGTWGYMSAATIQSSGVKTIWIANGPQAWFVSLVLFPWWLLIMVLAAGIILRTFGEWGDLAEIVATILYSFTFRPVPPAIESQMQEQQSPPPQQQGAPPPIALSHIPLNQCTQFALVQLESNCLVQLGSNSHGGQGSPLAAPLEIRIVPRAWNVKEGDNISPMGAGKEIVLAVAHSYSHLMAVAKKIQADQNALA